MANADYGMKHPTPIIRIFDEAKAREFYVDFLGFKVDWEHRFEADFPLYMQISLGGCVLHLSEHHGDCSPGASLRIEIGDARGYQEYLAQQKYKFAKPGLGKHWGCLDICVGDPFGNKLTFFERLPEEA